MRTDTTQVTEPIITGEELLEMGDMGPCELIDGRIVPLSPTGGRHGFIELQLGAALRDFVRDHNAGWVMTGEVGLYTRRRPDRVRGADIVFLSRERWPDGPPAGFLEDAPDLIVEIMSPNDRWQEVRQKVEEYFAIGVVWVWIVEPENRSVVMFRSSSDLQTLDDTATLIGEEGLAGFSCAVATLFDV